MANPSKSEFSHPLAEEKVRVGKLGRLWTQGRAAMRIEGGIMVAGDGLLERNVLLLAPCDHAGRRALRDAETRRPRLQPSPAAARLAAFDPARRGGSRATGRVAALDRAPLLVGVDVVRGPRRRRSTARLAGRSPAPGPLRPSFGSARERDRPTATKYVDADGQALAQLARERDDVRLTFTEEVASDPFTKMLLLAAALRSCP